MAQPGKRKKKRGPGRPPLASREIRGGFRLDEETVKALVGLAGHWRCTKSEALRRAIKELAVQQGVTPQRRGSG